MDRFEFSFIPYKSNSKLFPLQESIIEKSPHNEFLRFAAEDGILIVLLGLFLIIYAIVVKREIVFKAISKGDGIFAFALILFLFIESLLQFPFDTPYTFLILTFLIGYLVYKIFLERSRRLSIKTPRAILTLINIIYISIFSPLLYARYAEAQFPFDLKKISIACNLNPSNWRICLKKAHLELVNNDTKTAILSLQNELKKHKDNFVAKRMLGIALLERLEWYQGCLILKGYDTLFRNQSSLHSIVEALCSKKALDTSESSDQK